VTKWLEAQTRPRSIKQALADLIAKRDALPTGHPYRPSLERMIFVLETEIAFRAARDARRGNRL
jgi:hypothetical protein